jgi:hemerythrin superfamily protein
MDAIEMLEKEHKAAGGVMEKILKSSGPERKTLFEGLKKALLEHDHIEETVFYPFVQSRPKAAGFQAQDKQAHEAVETALAHLSKLPVDDKAWLPDFKDMQAKLLKHVADEEKRIFIAIRTLLSPEELSRLGEKMTEAKRGQHAAV